MLARQHSRCTSFSPLQRELAHCGLKARADRNGPRSGYISESWERESPIPRWARPKAVAAADTLVGIVRHGTVGLPVQGCRWACRGARRFETVQASSHGEKVVQTAGRLLVGQFMKCNQG